MRFRVAALIVLAVAPLSFGQKKNEMAELNREIGLLRDDLLKMQDKMDGNLANIKAAIQATLDQVNATNRSMAVLDKAMRDRFKEQEQGLNTPVAALGSKVDGMADEFSKVREAVTDLSARMSKIQQQLVDLDTAIKVRAAPIEPPSSAAPAATTPPAGVSATSLWEGAVRDKTSGNYDLALDEFYQYLKYFPDTESAPEAQYSIGLIYFAQHKFPEAQKAFDIVLEKYPDNAKTLEARLMKGKTLVKLGERDAAAEEFRAIVAKAKGKEIADRAAAELKALRPSAAAPAKRGRKQN